MSATSYKSQRLIKCSGCDCLTGCILNGSALDCNNHCNAEQHNDCITKMNSNNSFTEGKCAYCQKAFARNSMPKTIVVHL